MPGGRDQAGFMRERTEEAREVRKNYRALRKTARDNAIDRTGTKAAEELCQQIDLANELLQRVEKPREQYEDAELFREFAEQAKNIASKLVAGTATSMTPKEFISRLRRMHVRGTGVLPEAVEEDPALFDWDKLGKSVSGLFSCVPGMSTMTGPLDTQPKERKAAVRQKKRPLGELHQPDLMDNEEMDSLEKQETDKNMEEMWKLLHKESGVPLLNLIMNHQSFAQTVENLFTLSFLVKDQRVKLMKSPQGLSVYKAKQAEQADFDAGRAENMQFIIQMDMNLWNELKQEVQPAQCLMQNRESRGNRPATVGIAAKSKATRVN